MPTINTEVEFDVLCSKCNKNLDVTIADVKGSHRVWVESCDNCMDDARSDGYADGMKDGTEH